MQANKKSYKRIKGVIRLIKEYVPSTFSCAVAAAFFDLSNLDTDSHEYNPASVRETSSIVNKLSTIMVPSLKYGSLFVIFVASTTLSPFFQTNFANVPFVLHFKIS